MDLPVCPACEGRGWHPWWAEADVPGGWVYLACEGCGLPRLDPLPTAEEAAALYRDTYFEGGSSAGYADYVADARVHRANARRHLRRLARRAPRAPAPRRLVEIGAAAGFLLDEARRAGFEVAGVDVSPRMRARCAELHDIALADSFAALGREPASIDVLVANQVLEHVVDPLALLREIAPCMAPGGVLSIETWDRGALVARAAGRGWQQISPPSVVWLWDRAQLTALLARAGFRVLVLRPALKWVSLATVTGQLGSAVPAAVGRLPLPYALGDLVVAVAEPR